jgi:multidrug efflux pump subunit AcrA (membrane-fusion protein)
VAGDVVGFRSRTFPGRAEAVDEVDLSFRVSGQVIEFPVRVGDQVEKGTLLAALDPIDYRTALDLARGNLQRAQAELLAMEAGARPEEILQLQAGLSEAQASLNRATAEHERNARCGSGGGLSIGIRFVAVPAGPGCGRLKTAQEALRIGQRGAREEDRQAKRGEIKALQAAGHRRREPAAVSPRCWRPSTEASPRVSSTISRPSSPSSRSFGC